MGQCSNRGADGTEEFSVHAVSLEKAKSLSSNAAVTSARYHYLTGGRKIQDDYDIDSKVLGQGLCGDVILARGKIDRRKYALKTIRKQQVAQSKLQQLTAEVEIYLTLDHPNIARLHDVYETDTDIRLLTECCEGGELYFRLQKRGVYTDADAAEATRQMLRAVGYLHSHRVVHRDLKLENFLYESDEPTSQLKLIDFGFAKVWDPSTMMMASCGSIAYVSPDVLSGRGYTNKCDLWSLGVIVWMLLAGYPPFHGDEKFMMTKIKAGQPDWSHRNRWRPVSEEAVDFVKRLLSRDPNLRPSAQESLKHPWLTRGLATMPAALSRDALRSLQRYADASRIRRAVLQLLAQELGPEETRELREVFLAIDKSNEGTIRLRDLKDAIRSGASRSPARRKKVTDCYSSPKVRGGQNPYGSPNPYSSPKIHGSPNPHASPAPYASPAQFTSPNPYATPNPHASPNILRIPTPAAAQSPFGGESGVSVSSAGSPTTPARTLRRAPSCVLDELFSMLDANGDEQIYYSDFLAATMQARSRLREESVRATFHRLDADSSGTISVQDFTEVLGETFEGVSVEELVKEADPSHHGEITFEAFMKVLEDHDAVPSSATPSPKRTVSRTPNRPLSFFPEEGARGGG